MDKLSQMPEKERIKATNENRCCASAPHAQHITTGAKHNMEALYCLEGKSVVCITKQSGCICPACPVTDKLGLEKDYFCTKELKQNSEEDYNLFLSEFSSALNGMKLWNSSKGTEVTARFSSSSPAFSDKT
jgi:hypothetical protein